MINFFLTYKPIFIILHAFAAAAGLGAVLVTDTLFLRFIKDNKISHKEFDTLGTISRWIWIAIIFLVITGFALYFSAPTEYLTKSKFVTKLIIFTVIVINGVLMHYVVMPVIKKLSFGGSLSEKTQRLSFIKKFAFASGGISLLSWVLVFLLGSLRSIPFSVGGALGMYVLGIVMVIIASQVVIQFRK